MFHAHFRVRALAFIILLAGLASSPAADDPFAFSAPKGWRPERIPFPLGFAPAMEYRGFEELRFGPGMFKPDSETYWTYGFFWWLEGDQKVDAKSLKRDLEIYYRGLSKAVGSRNFKIESNEISAEVAKVKTDARGAGKGAHKIQYTAKLKTYDAFVTGKLLDLRVEISKHYYTKLNRTWVWFNVSPKADNQSVWKTMRAMRDSFEVRK